MAKHARKKENRNTVKNVGIVGAVGLGLSIPLMGSGTAQAASVDAWDRIAKCESNNRWNLPYGDSGRSSGGLQFQPASWSDALAELRRQGVDTSGYPQGSGHQAYKATKKQQIIAGEALLKLQGPRAWACNSMVGYPLASSGPNSSMFKGGVNPYPTTSTPAPKPTPSTPAKPSTPAPSTPSNSGGTYKVQKGDSLFSIAKAKLGSGDKWRELYDLNKKKIGSTPDLIYPGTELALPSSKYTVKKGDTLSGIATAHKIKGGWKNLYDANKAAVGSNPHKINIGLKLTLPAGTVAPSATVTKPAKPAPVTKPATPAPSASWVHPVRGNVTYSYGTLNSRYTLGYHTGADFSLPAGTPVKAVGAGTVVKSGYVGSYGNEIIIKHNDGRYSQYAHLLSRNVSVGATVKAGQQIGLVGSTGASSGPHLHFEIRTSTQFGSNIDPIKYLRGKGVTI